MTLQKALNIYNKKRVNIQMRTYQGGSNRYLGMCIFSGGELSGDDRFHLEDEVIMWEAPEENKMIVWRQLPRPTANALEVGACKSSN